MDDFDLQRLQAQLQAMSDAAVAQMYEEGPSAYRLPEAWLAVAAEHARRAEASPAEMTRADMDLVGAKELAAATASNLYRLTSSMIDVAALALGVAVTAGLLQLLSEELAVIGSVALIMGYFPFMEFRWQGTVGKRLLGLRVVSEDGAAPSLNQVLARSSRYGLYSLNFVPALLGSPWWHDLVSHTIVVRARRPSEVPPTDAGEA